MTRALCQYPAVEPSTENPGGDCRAARATMAAPLGQTGRWLALCPFHARHRADAVPIGEVPEP